MSPPKTRSTPLLLLVVGMPLLAIAGASGAAPVPCEVLSAEAWSSVMGYTATAMPGDMVCTYESKSGGGQLRIVAVFGTSAEAQAGAKRLRDQQPKGNPNAWRGVVESQGPVVFSISLFQPAATARTASQLQELVGEAKQHLPTK